MRMVVLAAALLAATSARAADDTLATGGSHEVVWTPPTTWPVRGPRFAPITLDIYIQLGHSPSYVAADLARRTVERVPDLRAVVHLAELTRAAEPAAEALVEAAEQGRFFALFDRMVHARLSFAAPVDLVRMGRDAGLDAARLEEALTSRRHRAEVERLLRESRLSGHRAIEVLVNGRRIPNSPWISDDTLNHALAEARARADELLADGVPLSQLYERLLDVDEEVPFVMDPTARGGRRRLTIPVGSSPTRGPATAAVTVVVWANFACMQCADVTASVARLMTAHPGLVRVVWKHYPSQFRQQLGQVACEYAAAAHAQGRFWALHDVAMTSRLVPARVTRTELDRMSLAAGLDEARMRLDIGTGHALTVVQRDGAEAQRLGVPTPGSVAVNGLPIAGPPSYELLERLVTAELDAGVLERIRERQPPRARQSSPRAIVPQ
jgi:protein-disulfide isomerase